MCQSEHDAIIHAAVRCTSGYDVTGVRLCICARHCLIQKNGVGDLQKGEKYALFLMFMKSGFIYTCRYCNMDFIVLSTLAGVKLPCVVLPYDIGCQYSKSFMCHMEEFPDDMKIDLNTQVDIGIPGWHINRHGLDCKANFNLSFMDGIGQTCGEEVETTWAHTNVLGISVQKMGLGTCHETFNDYWNGWNFCKIVGFRGWLLFSLFSYPISDETQAYYFLNGSSTPG
jgi:hypothetical protein